MTGETRESREKDSEGEVVCGWRGWERGVEMIGASGLVDVRSVEGGNEGKAVSSSMNPGSSRRGGGAR